MRTVFITGANSGIGLEFARQYAARGDRVWATCRKPEQATELHSLDGDVRVRALDVTVETQMRTLAAQVDSLDILIHNAGTFAASEEGLANVDLEKMLTVFRVNTIAPILLTKHLAPALLSGACVAALTSGSGVLRNAPDAPGGQYSYSASKAALARVIRTLAGDLHPKGVNVIGLNPGFVRTRMTQGVMPPPPLSSRESVAGMMATLDSVTAEHSGHFFDWEGTESPWLLP